ncbi:uncharacterized protein STEHIDRAFT_107609 [Stereum hirsutum FP-91666 SS1]|uniref:uncharacterized protein n=1 Tax=Stereum hirsutum (strain FP-91666) TaxID=721885 RepID=UPI000440A7A1|nr:uncharacterized protein STEHIDRAFT_107609 [Stereum hirsutum FP-91666 SS1]EIM90902.1 hypothetical protein STEHIDRAFT_107609 [Stereum hirsutum FP-91666 SS1]
MILHRSSQLQASIGHGIWKAGLEETVGGKVGADRMGERIGRILTACETKNVAGSYIELERKRRSPDLRLENDALARPADDEICYNAHGDEFGDDEEESGMGGTKVKAEGQEQVEPPKAVAAEEPRKEYKQTITHATRAWRLQRGNTLASPEKSSTIDPARRPQTSHRPATLPRGTWGDHIAMLGTSATMCKARSTGQVTGLSGYDVVEDWLGGGRARVVGAESRNWSCRALSARSRKDGRGGKHSSREACNVPSQRNRWRV